MSESTGQAATERISVIVNATNGEKGSGEITCFRLPVAERAKRAGKRLGILWLAAGLCVFIPMVHFVLVPLFFITGIGVAVSTFMQRDRISASGITCPDCQKLSPIPEMKEAWPINFVCPNCGRHTWIEKKSQ